MTRSPSEQFLLQSIFDKVSKHLLTQNEKAAIGPACKYRLPDGKMCAVGVLLEDMPLDAAFYLEGTVESDEVLRLLAQRGYYGHEVRCLLTRLQTVHDYNNPAHWYTDLLECAQTFALDPPVLAQ